jgi:TolB-like protein/DNA-binding winged helix-turn-helix (wHTH) protein/tetratricopeptide (TPR) repeat protein
VPSPTRRLLPSIMESRGHRFGAFELDTHAGELRRRGLRVRLRGRPIEILRALLERPGDLVTRDELRARLWTADTFVDFDHGLNSSVNKLREALDDTAENPRFIETVPRRGYRWIGPVEALAPAPIESSHPPAVPGAGPTSSAFDGVLPAIVPAAPLAEPAPVSERATEGATPAQATSVRRRRMMLGLGAALVAGIAVAASMLLWWQRRPQTEQGSGAAHRAMLVVLPFQTVGGGPDQEFFGDGITEEMIAQIGALDPVHLGVIARTTAMQYKRSTRGVMAIGQELHVDYVLEGSVRRDNSRARISARLVDVTSQTQLWSETYERDLKDVLMLQRDVATRIARSLAGGVLSPFVARNAAAAPATSPPFAAYELMLRARMLRQQATEEGAWQCVATLEEALRIDDLYAPAHAALADCYRLLGAPGWEAGPPAELLLRARREADRALELDASLPEGHAVRGMVRFSYDWDLPAARRDLEHAIALNPSYARAHQYLSSVLTTMGRFDEAVKSARYARELDPLSITENTTVGVRLYYARQFEAATEAFERTLRINPDFAVAHWGLGETRRELQRYDDAIASLRRAVALSGNSAYMRAWLAHALASAGRRDEALAIRGDLERIASGRYVSPFLFALMASGFHDRTETLAWLQKVHDARSGWTPFLSVEPQFAWLLKDPDFLRVMADVRR